MHVECVTNVVPTINDDEAELRSIGSWIAEHLGPDTPWHVTRFMTYLEFAHVPPTPIPTLERAREIGHESGLHFVFLGNVAIPGGEDTVCPTCGTRVVERRGFGVVAEKLTAEGACATCGTPLGIASGKGRG
jgi:pyruvate formate lyase activating enzyme